MTTLALLLTALGFYAAPRIGRAIARGVGEMLDQAKDQDCA